MAWTLYLIAVAAIVLAVLHAWQPELGIDTTSVLLLAVAAAALVLPYVKYLKLPGAEVWFEDFAKVAERARAVGLVEAGDAPRRQRPGWENVAEDDPRLAMAGLRIELERALRKLAGPLGPETSKVSVRGLIELLAGAQALSAEQASVLRDLTAQLNKAVHGVDLPQEAATWAVSVGRGILSALETKTAEMERRAVQKNG